jgi:hypothetical protein
LGVEEVLPFLRPLLTAPLTGAIALPLLAAAQGFWLSKKESAKSEIQISGYDTLRFDTPKWQLKSVVIAARSLSPPEPAVAPRTDCCVISAAVVLNSLKEQEKQCVSCFCFK